MCIRDSAGESNSIVHQKRMLEDYAIKDGFTNLVHFTDDGWSEATFYRPSWNRLVEGVKNGEITVCICKDMSRIGRDCLLYTSTHCPHDRPAQKGRARRGQVFLTRSGTAADTEYQ